MHAPAGARPIRAVLFDAVGTLIRPYPSVGSVYGRAAAVHGLNCPPAALNREFHHAYRELTADRFRGDGFRTSEACERRWWKKVVACTFERAGGGVPPAAVTEGAFEAFARGEAWRLYADAARVLPRLRALGFRLGLVSNYDSRLRRVLSELNLSGYFETVTISSECGRAKPSPRIFQAALRAMDLEPAEALYVGDRPEEDYRAPRRAGLRALWLVRDGRRGGGDVIRSLDRIPARLARGLSSATRRP